MAINWDDSLLTGVDDIDDQHRELFRRFNNLLAACNQGQGREEVLRTLTFLDDYIRSHFHEEELMQQRSNFPDYPAHRAQHDNFIATTEALADQFRSEGASLGLLVKTNTTLMEWLVGHIRKMDRAFARHLNAGRTAG
ncbi:bacteriohemerythrin [Desulfuromonas carbonis]|uniref:bacteriohemerythrin n=1 Tax=Desulfuromonas sp. DDH964 TaxID=1823759 RepID=UPI00078B397D|nr:bacteriohemerythrin [Desulfuromonas sp. DDH964]AMV72804.1 hemerythrin family protein [Desulfuromonas sp. DDH964]